MCIITLLATFAVYQLVHALGPNIEMKPEKDANLLPETEFQTQVGDFDMHYNETEFAFKI